MSGDGPRAKNGETRGLPRFELGSDRRYVHVEPYIDGAYAKFSKYNSNTFNALLLLSDRHADPISGAFSHFTYEHTDKAMVVCDIQGVLTAKDELTITDPQIHTTSKSDDFGCGNGQSEDHVRAFFASHQCQDCCLRLGLKHPYKEDLITGLTKVQKGFAWSPFFQRKNHFTSGFLHSVLFARSSTPLSATAHRHRSGGRVQGSRLRSATARARRRHPRNFLPQAPHTAGGRRRVQPAASFVAWRYHMPVASGGSTRSTRSGGSMLQNSPGVDPSAFSWNTTWPVPRRRNAPTVP